MLLVAAELNKPLSEPNPLFITVLCIWCAVLSVMLNSILLCLVSLSPQHRASFLR